MTKTTKETAPTPPESIIAQLAKNTQAEPNYLRSLLLGFSGTGKSLGATTAPGRKLFLDFDGRASSIIKRPDVEVIAIKEPDPENPAAWNIAKKLLLQIKSETSKGVFPYDSLIFDGITMMGRYALSWALTLDPKRGLGGGAAKQHYLPQMNELSKYILSSLSLPLNIIYTAHLELVEDKVDETFFILPKTTGKLRTELPGWFNETYLTHKIQKGRAIQYLWTLTGVDKYQFCKTAFTNVPNQLEIKLNETPAGFQKLIAL